MDMHSNLKYASELKLYNNYMLSVYDVWFTTDCVIVNICINF